MADICAVTVLAGLTEAEDSHWGVGLMGLEYDPSAVTTCPWTAEFNAYFVWKRNVFQCLLALILIFNFEINFTFSQGTIGISLILVAQLCDTVGQAG